MVDITNRPFQEGDILLEIYQGGRITLPHVVHGGFTPLYIRTVCIFSGGGLTFKSRVKPKSVIIVTEEQFLGFVDKSVENRRGRDGFSEVRTRETYNKLLQLSRRLKAER